MKPVQWIYCVYALITFAAIMLLALPFVVIASFLGAIKGGNFIYKICKVWGILWYALVGVWHKNIYEKPHNFNDHFIFVANHTSYMDIPAVIMCMYQPVRVLGKYEMVKFPIFGYIYKCAVITVDRSSSERRAQSVRQLKAALRKNISIFIFPEGTFNETGAPLKNFYDGAFRIAIETQTPIKPLLFIDAIDRLHYRSIFELTPGPNRVVYLEEVPIENRTMHDLPELKKKVYDIMEAGLRRYRNYPDVDAAAVNQPRKQG
ncbi:1-acyl-sn-glycerol-3-phosphate acyltransferase [Segetibacter sp. 3557_3]|nr:1-acyl-sn-glycerol-3-phosphate acyltransferase [Segetibacter sp. 3557_3]